MTLAYDEIKALEPVEKKQGWTQLNVSMKTGERLRAFCKKHNYRIGDFIAHVVNNFIDRREEYEKENQPTPDNGSTAS